MKFELRSLHNFAIHNFVKLKKIICFRTDSFFVRFYLSTGSQHRGFLKTFLVSHHTGFCLEESSRPRFLWRFIYRRCSCSVLGLIHGGMAASPRENLQPCWRGCCLSLGPLPSTNPACPDLRGAIATGLALKFASKTR